MNRGCSVAERSVPDSWRALAIWIRRLRPGDGQLHRDKFYDPAPGPRSLSAVAPHAASLCERGSAPPAVPFAPVSKQEIQRRIQQFLGAHPSGVLAAYLHGSAARHQMRPDSDIDVAVLLGEPVPSGSTALGQSLAADLESALGRLVDLTVLNLAPPDLIHRVLCNESLIFDCDPSARIRFEVRARNEYFDVRPRLDEYRRLYGRAS